MSIPARVESYLNDHGVGFELVAHKATGSTHESASAAHVPEDHMAKAVMVRDGQGHAMVVIPGNTWVRLDLLNSDSGRAFRLDEESELKELFPDCEFGAVPVTGPAYGVETFVDEALASLSYVCFESGDHEHLVRVQGGDFAKLMSGVRHGHFARAE